MKFQDNMHSIQICFADNDSRHIGKTTLNTDRDLISCKPRRIGESDAFFNDWFKVKKYYQIPQVKKRMCKRIVENELILDNRDMIVNELQYIDDGIFAGRLNRNQSSNSTPSTTSVYSHRNRGEYNG